jgi:hypothetical protein
MNWRFASVHQNPRFSNWGKPRGDAGGAAGHKREEREVVLTWLRGSQALVKGAVEVVMAVAKVTEEHLIRATWLATKVTTASRREWAEPWRWARVHRISSTHHSWNPSGSRGYAREHNRASQHDSSSEEVEWKEAVNFVTEARPEMARVGQGTAAKGVVAWSPWVSREIERERGERVSVDSVQLNYFDQFDH